MFDFTPRFVPLLVLVGLVGLAACDSVVTDQTDAEARTELAVEYNRQSALFGSLAAVPDDSLIATGTATYDGVTRIVVDTPQTTEVLGEARIAVNFGTDRVAAQFGNFYGRANGGAVVGWTETTPVSATGVIDVTQPGGQFIQTLMSGALRSDTGNVMVLGPMPLDGTFRDTSPSVFSAPDAMVLQSGPGSIRLDGLNYGNETGTNCETCVWVIAED